MDILWFVVAVPLSIELLAAMLAFIDLGHRPGLWPRVLERLAVPTAALGAVLWAASPLHWDVIAFAVLVVLAWQVVVFLVQRWFTGNPKFSAARFDTDEDA